MEWAQQRLNVPRETLRWSLLPEYAEHKWHGDVDPLARALMNISQFKWTAIESATATGKTFMAAIAMLYILDNYPGSLVVTIAPKGDQLRLNMWKEIQRLHPAFGRGELQALHLRMNPPNDSWHAIGFVAGVSAAEAEHSATRAQGHHDDVMLIIAEECPGVHPAVLTAFENTCTRKQNVILAIGNPDSEQDTLHKFSIQQHVDHIRISGFDHPNVVTRNPDFIPGAQTKVGLDRMLAKYRSPDNRMYQSRAEGICPTESTDSLIRWDWCVAASRRTDGEDGSMALGADVANSADGDLAAIAKGPGSVLLSVEDKPCPNANRLGEDIHVIAVAEGISDEHIGVDGVGVGAGTVNELKRLGRNVRDIQSGAKAVEIYTQHGDKMVETFRNLRSQMWWLLRLDLQFGEASKIVLPYDEELFADLCTPRFSTKNGVIAVEAKEELKKRLGRSPNKGDAVVYWNWVRSHRGAVPIASTKDFGQPQQRTTAQDVRRVMVDRRRTW